MAGDGVQHRPGDLDLALGHGQTAGGRFGRDIHHDGVALGVKMIEFRFHRDLQIKTDGEAGKRLRAGGPATACPACTGGEPAGRSTRKSHSRPGRRACLSHFFQSGRRGPPDRNPEKLAVRGWPWGKEPSTTAVRERREKRDSPVRAARRGRASSSKVAAAAKGLPEREEGPASPATGSTWRGCPA